MLPAVEQINKPITLDEAPHVAGIGAAHSADGSVSFIDAVSDTSLLPLQPSVPLSDDDATSYIFRIRDRIIAHRPASIAEVTSVVESDWKLKQAFELCKLDAAHLQAAAGLDGITAAARPMNVSVDTPAAFSLAGSGAQDPIAGLPLSGDAVDLFRTRCQALLTDAAQHVPAVTTIESPRDAKIVVAELSSVKPEWPEGYRQFAEAQTVADLRRQFSQPVAAQWFSLAAAEQRLGYKDTAQEKSAG